MLKRTQEIWFTLLLIASQVVALAAVYSVYFKHVLPPLDPSADPSEIKAKLPLYGLFQDIHVMIFVGFGFLLTSFHKFRLTSLTMCFWVAALSVEYYFVFNMMWGQIFHRNLSKDSYVVNTSKLIYGEVSAGAILIALCAVIGKVNDIQCFFITIVGIFLYTLNEEIVTVFLKCRDVGGAMIIHTFGAFFGIGITTVFNYTKSLRNRNAFETQQSLSSAMAGTLFLWCFWPSFNAALATTPEEINIAVLNTYFSLIGSVTAAYSASLLIGGGKFTMGQILNATLAGGVVMGSGADILYDGYVAYICGSLIGVISTICFAYVPKWLDQKDVFDVAGVLNLHGIPGVIAGLLSAIFRAKYIDDKGGNQVAGTFISVGIGLFGGILTGIIAKPMGCQNNENDFYNDMYNVNLEEEEVHVLSQYGSGVHADNHTDNTHKPKSNSVIPSAGFETDREAINRDDDLKPYKK